MEMSKLIRPSKERNARRGKIVTLYGEPGVGKTTLAWECWPAPVLLPVENGLNAVPDAPAFPTPKTFDQVIEFIDAFGKARRTGDTDRETLIIDSLTQIDLMIADHLCKTGSVESLSDYGGGYGRGAEIVGKKQRMLRKRCDRLLDLGVHVVAITHAVSKKEQLPDIETFNRWGVKLTKDSIAEWVDDVDAVIHLKMPITMTEASKREKKRMLATTTRGKRSIVMTPSPTSLAKNRCGVNRPLAFRYDSSTESFNNPLAEIFGFREDPKGTSLPDETEDVTDEETDEPEGSIVAAIADDVAAEPGPTEDQKFMEEFA